MGSSLRNSVVAERLKVRHQAKTLSKRDDDATLHTRLGSYDGRIFPDRMYHPSNVADQSRMSSDENSSRTSFSSTAGFSPYSAAARTPRFGGERRR